MLKKWKLLSKKQKIVIVGGVILLVLVLAQFGVTTIELNQ